MGPMGSVQAVPVGSSANRSFVPSLPDEKSGQKNLADRLIPTLHSTYRHHYLFMRRKDPTMVGSISSESEGPKAAWT